MSIDGSGTRDDLIADARAAGHEVTVRMITDWVARGLLDQPTRQPKGRGHGSNKGLYSQNQRRLFITLLGKRPSNHLRSLARVPLYLWLYWGDDYVPTRQAIRAFDTWLGDFRVSKEAAKQAAQQLLGRVDHPDATSTARRALLKVLADIAYHGRIDEEALSKAAEAVFEPEHRLIKRAVGPVAAPLTTDNVVNLLSVRLQAAQHFRDGFVTEDHLEQARSLILETRADYLVELPGMASQVPDQLVGAFQHPSDEMKALNCGTDLLTMLGIQLRINSGRRQEHVTEFNIASTVHYRTLPHN
ncbi:hypothetical protein [Actinophytocola sp.]|uniref:hypothetical protein n=1 Tax=Actinophytocola sp. TaxID=1872138 RepID=UPI00389B2D47